MVFAREHDDPIDLPRFAEVMALLRHFAATPSDDVIARLGLSKAAWEAATVRWYAARDAEIARGETEVTRRFGRLFAKALRDLTRRSPSLASLGPPAPPAPQAPSWSPPPPVAPSSPSPPVAPSPSPPSPAPPAFLPPGRQLAGTADISAVVQGQILPFVAPPPPSPRVEERPPQGFGETVGLAPGAGGAPPLPPGLPDLTLPQYASLRVELQTRPEATSATLARYGLRPETRDALDDHFRARFEVDPLLRMEFVRAYAIYLGWLRQQRGG